MSVARRDHPAAWARPRLAAIRSPSPTTRSIWSAVCHCPTPEFGQNHSRKSRSVLRGIFWGLIAALVFHVVWGWNYSNRIIDDAFTLDRPTGGA
jgi:hypothetical protein